MAVERMPSRPWEFSAPPSEKEPSNCSMSASCAQPWLFVSITVSFTSIEVWRCDIIARSAPTVSRQEYRSERQVRLSIEIT